MVRPYAFAAAFVLAIARMSAAQVHDPCQSVVLPVSAQSLIATKLPEWRTKQVSDLSSDDQQLWMKAHPKECPGVASGHFETPDELSYALVLVPKSDASSSYKVIVLSKAASADAYSLRVLDHAEGRLQAGTGPVISRLRPGTYPDFERTKSVRMTLDSINVEWIESAAVVYYWSNGRYRTLQTED
jgi:hypothetical protein